MAGKGKLGKHASKGKAKRLVKKAPAAGAHWQVTKGALRRLARRGGVKRISETHTTLPGSSSMPCSSESPETQSFTLKLPKEKPSLPWTSYTH